MFPSRLKIFKISANFRRILEGNALFCSCSQEIYRLLRQYLRIWTDPDHCAGAMNLKEIHFHPNLVAKPLKHRKAPENCERFALFLGRSQQQRPLLRRFLECRMYHDPCYTRDESKSNALSPDFCPKSPQKSRNSRNLSEGSSLFELLSTILSDSKALSLIPYVLRPALLSR